MLHGMYKTNAPEQALTFAISGFPTVTSGAAANCSIQFIIACNNVTLYWDYINNIWSSNGSLTCPIPNNLTTYKLTFPSYFKEFYYSLSFGDVTQEPIYNLYYGATGSLTFYGNTGSEGYQLYLFNKQQYSVLPTSGTTYEIYQYLTSGYEILFQDTSNVNGCSCQGNCSCNGECSCNQS